MAGVTALEEGERGEGLGDGAEETTGRSRFGRGAGPRGRALPLRVAAVPAGLAEAAEEG